MAYTIDPNTGQVVWSGPGPDPGIQLPRSLGSATAEQQLGYLQDRAAREAERNAPQLPQLPAYAGSLPRAQQEAILRQQYEMRGLPFPGLPGAPTGGARDWERRGGYTTQTAPTAGGMSDDASAALVDMFARMGAGGGGGGGYRPQFVDTRAAESMLPLTETEAERSAIQSLLDDLAARAGAATTAVRTGWDMVRSANEAAAAKARQMAAEAGPEAARLWTDAANQALRLSAQAAEAMGQFAGMQSVNVSPTRGVQNIAALMAAQAPRAQQLAERLGIISAEDIAAQSRTAAMMGEAYAGEIQRTSIIQAKDALAKHNERVLSRIAANQTAIANMRFQAAQTNAQIANSAAQFAASRAEQIGLSPRQLVEDINLFGTVEFGNIMLADLYGFSPEIAQQIIDGTKNKIIDWAQQQATAELTSRAGRATG